MEHQRRRRPVEGGRVERRARLRILDGGEGGPSGVASVGYVGRRDIFSMTVDGIAISGDIRCGQRIRLPDRGFRRVKCVYGARMVLHRVKKSELGDPWDAQRDGDRRGARVRARPRAPAREEHVRGDELPAESICPKPAGQWEKRCRLLEADDVAGAIRRYGGRANALAPEFCDLYPPPPPPLTLTAGVDEDGFLAIRWTPPPGVTGTVVTVARDACSTDGGTIYPGTCSRRSRSRAATA